ncbi:hypothetical protein BKA83DRAFT_4625159 [Pisolithus microcarpus]|nr:hypothetical protein BKA83DRAFT_4625159 [Pisolithus microcarpus]
MSSVPGTRVLNVVDDVIYVEVTGSLSKWNTHTFSVNIESPGLKKVVLRLQDTVNTVLPPERKFTLEEEALEEVKEASSNISKLDITWPELARAGQTPSSPRKVPLWPGLARQGSRVPRIPAHHLCPYFYYAFLLMPLPFFANTTTTLFC